MEEHLNQEMEEHLGLSTLEISRLKEQVYIMTKKHLLTMILKDGGIEWML